MPIRTQLLNRHLAITQCAAFLIPLLIVLAVVVAAQSQTPRVPTGTYAIAEAKDLEARTLYHFLYLHPSGRFLMAAEWPHHETSRAAGRWSATAGPSGVLVTLTGTAHVATSQGTWDVDFRRIFKTEDVTGPAPGSASLVKLVPEFEKNRFGMLGWPNAYVFRSAQPAPTLPNEAIPRDEARLVALMDSLIAQSKSSAR